MGKEDIGGVCAGLGSVESVRERDGEESWEESGDEKSEESEESKGSTAVRESSWSNSDDCL